VNEPQAADFFLAPMVGRVGKLIGVGQMLNGEGFRKYQHAGIYLGSGMTLEAYPGGAIYGSIDRFAPESLVWSTGLVALSPRDRERIVSIARTYLGTPYSFLDYGALAAKRFHIPAPHLKAFIESGGHMICSQLVDRVYEEADVHLFSDGRWPGYVTPASLGIMLDEIRDFNIGQGI
jgi:cell wall-associated NlpC family hydrolase